MSQAQPQDVYLDDNIHYELSVELGVLSCTGQNSDGADLWNFCAPTPAQPIPSMPSAPPTSPVGTSYPEKGTSPDAKT